VNILVVAAHPDDEILGPGGAIALHAERGDKVYSILLGEGITSRREEDGVAPTTELINLKQNALEAASIIGVEKTYFFDFPDNKFDTIPRLRIIKAIESLKSEIKPVIVYTHHRNDLSIDHRITFDAVLTAFRPVAGETVRRILSFSVPSSTEWYAPAGETAFTPNVFVDISKTFEKKIMAMRAYKSEIREYPHPRSPEALEAIARVYGVTVGMSHVEPFVLVRELC
jgi:LmbE family N-acetylglucosaminyl deacetylase